MEAMSGIALDEVRVHRNSDKPAQLQAHAFAQGRDIHLGPGHEEHLPHEAWHVVQQMQGRVRPTIQLAGTQVNDDGGLESEADVMGARSIAPATPAVGRLARGSSRMVTQRHRIATIFGPLAVVQLVKTKRGASQQEDDPESAVTVPENADRALVARGNVARNRELLVRAYAQLPRRAQEYLTWLQSELSARDENNAEEGSRALATRRERTPIVLQLLGMDTELFATVLVGLKVMPKNDLLPKTLVGAQQLFFTLATAKYSLSRSLPLLESGEWAPVEVSAGEQRGVEHVQNSCYVASILNLIAAVPDYRRLFDSRLNPTQRDSQARQLQEIIAPLLLTLSGNGTVRAGEVTRLLTLLDHLGLLQGGADAVTDQQDASQVMMGILQRVQPQKSQLITLHDLTYDNPDALNPNTSRRESQVVLQLTAVGHRTLEAALAAYFGRERRAGPGIANPHAVRTTAAIFPPVLSIGMLRQSGSDQIDMPEVFRIPASITRNRQPGPRYRLQAFIVRNTFSHHSGGHYVAVMRDGQGGWAESDDMGKDKGGEPGVMTPRTRSVDVSTHAVGGHPAPAYALATLYTYVLDTDQEPTAPARISFPGSMKLAEDAIARSIFESIAAKDVAERERLTRKFLAEGGTEWEAIDFMRRNKDNTGLASAYDLCLMENRGEGSKGKRKDVSSSNKYYTAFKNLALSDLLNLVRVLPDQIARGAPSGPDQLEAVTALLRERQDEQRGTAYSLFFSDTSKSGTRLEVWGTKRLRKPDSKVKVQSWIEGVTMALLGSSFIASRKPSLVIRIQLRPQVTHDIASTYSVGNRITINMDDYQVTEFTVGQTIGLLGHEIGVHSLDSTTLSAKELEAETKDRASQKTGRHEGEAFTIGLNPKLAKQQDDHLTIGRALLGQLSALPRLNMYESTLVSLLEALPPKDRWDAAAAYCIDIARILVNNDDPTEMMSSNVFSKAIIASKIASTAAKEWQRMRTKHAKNEVVTSIEVSYFQIMGALLTLASLLDKVRKEAKKP